MREIKFRGKGWVYGTYYCGVMYPTSFEGHYVGDWLVDRATVGQFTGLLDKNGKEIYEGDILQYTYSRDTTGEDIVISKDAVEWEVFGGTAGWNVQITMNREIISNIYENPELLTLTQ
jgi:uncharacterized phage protein (TIGR01671 family)